MSSLPNPFMPDAVYAPPAAGSRWDELYDEAALWRAIFDEPLPMFISDPSPDFIAAMHRDVLPIIEDAVRRTQ